MTKVIFKFIIQIHKIIEYFHLHLKPYLSIVTGRSCGFTVTKEDKCDDLAGTETCYCSTDLCNSATGPRLPGLLLVTAVLAALAVTKF